MALLFFLGRFLGRGFLGLSGIAMLLAAFGKISPVAGAFLQEGIDVAVILNALRTLMAPKPSH